MYMLSVNLNGITKDVSVWVNVKEWMTTSVCKDVSQVVCVFMSLETAWVEYKCVYVCHHRKKHSVSAQVGVMFTAQSAQLYAPEEAQKDFLYWCFTV